MCPSATPNPDKQRTIKQPLSFSGISLHKGEFCQVTFSPAKADSGITFIYNGKRIPALAENVTDTRRGVTLGEVALVEHVLSACAGMGLDNLEISLSSPEPPILDGSALGFAQKLKAAGIMELDQEKRFFSVREILRISEADASLVLSPFDGFKIDFMIDFPIIGVMNFSYSGDFREIAPARTFGQISELEMLHKNGLAKGASLDNALAIGPKGYVNQPRFPDEPVRHKVLDLIGDLMLVGRPIHGAIRAIKSGHRHNVALTLKIREEIKNA
jgi:UDP-3-O-acyl N-acetylglucosamine deacetylase